MESPTVRLPQGFTFMGQEKQDMLDLNRRLETYLGRVKFLEEENQLLRDEIHVLRKNQQPRAQQRRALEAAVQEARTELDRAWREKDKVELEMENLSAELQSVAQQRQRVASARAQAQGRLLESRKEMEDERRAQAWLKDKVSQLEGELVLREQVHQEDMTCLKESMAHVRPVQAPPLAAALRTDIMQAQSSRVQSLGLEYSQKAAQAWREAAETYQRQVDRMEDSVGQAKARLVQITQERTENQLRLQGLAKDLEAVRTKKEMLERQAGQQRDRHSQEVNQMQAHVEALEEEKTKIGQQIDDLIIESRTLLKLKMSLGLEVATYRTLLDGEGLQVNEFPRNRHSTQTVSSTDGFPTLRELKHNLQETQFSTPVSRPSTTTAIRSSLQVKSQLTSSRPAAPVLSFTSISNTPEHQQHVMVEKKNEEEEEEEEEKERKSEDWPQPNIGDSLNGRDSVEHFRPEELYEEVTYASAISSTSATANAIPMEESFEREVDEDKPEVGHSAEASDMFVKEVSMMCDAMVHSTLPTCDTSDPQDFDAQQVDVLDTSEGKEPSMGDIGNPESDTADDLTEWMQLQQKFQATWAEKDPFTDRENTEKTDKQTEISETDEVNTEHRDLDVMTCMTYQPIKPLDHADTIDNDLAEPEDKNDFFDSERDTDVSQTLSGENVVDDECDQMNALECKEQDTENVYEDKAFVKPEEVVKNREVEKDEPRFTERQDKLCAESEGTEEIIEEKHESAEQYLSTGRDLEDDLFSIPHANFNINLEADTLPMIHEREQVVNSQEQPVSEDSFTWNKEMEGKEGDEDGSQEEQEEKNGEDLDDSPNVSMSWRTDPGELDSYALDNTLADTRPLIRYKSDDTDVNTQASHTFVSDSSDSEDDREAGPGQHRAVTKAKRFDTMEDLSEEPEVEAMNETEHGSDTPQTVVRDVHSENPYMPLQEEHGDAESETIAVETISALDEERSEMAEDLLQIDVKEVDETQKDVEETMDDKKAQEDTNVMPEEKAESETSILQEDFPEQTMDSVMDVPYQTKRHLNEPADTEELLSADVTTECVSQREPYEDWPKPEDQTTLFSISSNPLKKTKQPNLTEELLNEDIITTEPGSQRETITEQQPKPEDQIALIPTSSDPLQPTEQPLNEPHLTEQLLNEETTTENQPKADNEPSLFSTSAAAEPLEQIPTTLATAQDAVELLPESSEDISTERLTVSGKVYNKNDEEEFFVYNNDEEEIQELSMLTHTDLGDNLSLSSEPPSRPESQPHTANSDDEEEENEDESHSTEEESPNASPCLSPNAFAKLSQAHSRLQGAFEHFPGDSTEVSSDVLPTASQESSEYAMEQGQWQESVSEVDTEVEADMKDAADTFSPLEDIEHPSSTEANGNRPSQSLVDIIQDENMDEPPKRNRKDNDDLHSFFSSNMEADFWGSSRQMAATFDPDEINREQHQQSVTFQTRESLRLGREEEEEAWASPEAADERAEKYSSVPKLPLFGMVHQEGKSKVDALQGKGQKQANATQSDDSADEGDTWSSGEE
ncbi:nestin [Engraulis encrasicolus]|uniref:nestin n=1 Tax=Engraulis encrasicolus TaxID=184585 RepID=UPI002FCF745F